MKAKNKTIENTTSVKGFMETIGDLNKRKDFATLLELIAKQTGLEPKMWGTAIVGFGSYHYIYESGREGDSPLAGLAARANAITIYIGSEFEKREELLSKLGKHKTSKGCLYIRKLEDIDTGILLRMIKNSMDEVRKRYPSK